MARPLTERPAIDVLEDAAGLLRKAPTSAWLIYVAGAAPMALAVIYSVSVLSTASTSLSERVLGSGAITALYFWLQFSKARFVQHLRARLAFDDQFPEESWRISRLRAWMQGIKLVALPASLLALLPFAWTVALFRNLLALPPSAQPDMGRWWSEAARQAGLGKAQSWTVLAMLLPFTIVVFVNAATLLAACPFLAAVFSGYENEFATNPRIIASWTFFTAAIALTWMVVDPVIQAVYVVRCYAGEATRTGADLQVALRRLAILIVGAVVLTQPGSARTPSPAELQARVHEVLQKPEYAWARAQPAGEGVDRGAWMDSVANWIRGASHAIGRGIDHFLDWLQRVFLSNPIYLEPGQKGEAHPGVRWALMALILTMLAVIVTVIHRAFFKRKPRRSELEPEPASRLDSSSEDTLATELPDNEWMALAREAVSRGDFRSGLRALFLANLAWLGSAELVTVSRYKSNREYEKELQIRGRSVAATELFAKNRRMFESAWYGGAEKTADDLEFVRENILAMRTLFDA